MTVIVRGTSVARQTDDIENPLVGSLVLRITGDAVTHALLWTGRWSNSNIGRVSMADGAPLAIFESGAYEIDWLRRCTAGQACEITVGVDLDYARILREVGVAAAVRNESAPPPAPENRFTLEAEAKLEAFDDRSLPSEGMALSFE